jgi:hypothetical protein
MEGEIPGLFFSEFVNHNQDKHHAHNHQKKRPVHTGFKNRFNSAATAEYHQTKKQQE